MVTSNIVNMGKLFKGRNYSVAHTSDVLTYSMLSFIVQIIFVYTLLVTMAINTCIQTAHV